MEPLDGNMDDIILIKDLPPTLIESATCDLRQYTIAFHGVKDKRGGKQPELLGSGVLVSAGNTRAILTAHHVIEVLPRTGKLGLLLQKTYEPHSIDVQGVAFLKIARGIQDSIGPDLGAVILSPGIVTSVAAIKTFYNLDMQKERMINNPPDLRDGVWVAQGFLEERTVVKPNQDGRGFTKSFYNFSGVGGPEVGDQIGDFDYFAFPVSHEARQYSPKNWGGMSGGGLWQIILKREGDGLAHLPPLLSGIIFYQQPTTENECGVRGHGRRSVYEMAYNSIRGDHNQPA